MAEVTADCTCGGGCADLCGQFATDVKVLGPSTGSDCPFYLTATITSPNGATECERTVCRLIICRETARHLRDELDQYFPTT